MKEKNIKILLKTIIFIVTLVFALLISNKVFASSEICYLSDIPYMQGESYAASGHSIKLDQNDSNDLIRLKIDGNSTPFIKGICAWATSCVVYDLSQYNYDYFSSYLGVDISEQSGYFNTGVKFYIYTSDDCENWEEVYKTGTIDGRDEAIFAKVDIKGAKYLKLVADKNSSNWWAEWYDEAVYANAKLIKEDYEEDLTPVSEIKTVEEYDAYIKEHYGEEITGEYELNILQREFVNNVGYQELQAFVKYSDEYKNTILWLMNNPENLRLYLVGGKPEGNYIKSLKVLNKLYTKYKDTDLATSEISQYGKPLKELYLNMIISISLTHSGNVYLWITGTNQSDPITRYEIYKELHSENLIESKKFESLTVEEMRWVMNTVIDDEEIMWLNNYTRTKKNGATGPYSYIKYTFGYNYWKEEYYLEENYEKWDEKYDLSTYNITYEKGNPKLWIVFEEGSVCGGLSKTGSCVWGSYKGLPNTCVSQPGHCAYIFYDQDENGNGIWGLGNDVFGWGQSGRTEHLNVRMMNDWGNGSYSGGWNASYTLLAQAAQNEYEEYEKAEEVLMLANVYNDDSEKLKEIYRNALEVEEINFDAWLGLVNVYLNDENVSEEEYYSLAEEIAETLTYYPRPMYDLLTLLEPKFESPAYSVLFTMLRTKTLTLGTQATANETLQVTAVRQVASALLGFFDSNIASFSFDGENAGAIILSDQYGDSNVEWDYSLDGGNTWTQTEDHVHKLSEAELASITSEDDIKVHIIGVGYETENIYTIDIMESEGLPSLLYANDLENKLIAATGAMQWKYNENDEWTFYSDEEPDLTGDKTVMVKMGATGVYLESNDITNYIFTEDNQPNTRKYVSISNLSIHSVSSEATSNQGNATNAIDGNYNTRWHSAWNGTDTERFIVIKVDEPIYLSAVEYVPSGGGNGKILDGTIYGSMDGETWEELISVTNLENNETIKSFEIENPSQVQYIKIVADRASNGNWFTARMFNIFEDIDIKDTVTFSFDGPNKGKLILDDKYEGLDWKYSIDGGNTWKEVNEQVHELTYSEIEKINENDNIKILLDGRESEYIINIIKGTIPETASYVNDLENRLIGVKDIDTLEWKCEGDDKWTSYEEEEPIITGTKKLLVRTKAYGIHTASDAIVYQFTDDNQPETEKYITLEHLSIVDFSTESPDRGEPVEYAIDGDINTMWHTDHTITDDARYIVIKLDEPRYISKLQYARKPGYVYGIIKDAVIYTSMDGENWEEAVTVSDLYDPSDKDELVSSEDVKDIPFEESKQALYIKLQCTESCDYVNGSKDGVPYDYFLSASMINLFEDTTQIISEDPDSSDEVEDPDTSDTSDDTEDLDDSNTQDTSDESDILDDYKTEIEQGELLFKSPYKIVEKDENLYLYVEPNLTLKEFIENSETNGEISVYKEDGTLLEEDDILEKGMTLNILKDDDEVSLIIEIKEDDDDIVDDTTNTTTNSENIVTSSETNTQNVSNTTNSKSTNTSTTTQNSSKSVKKILTSETTESKLPYAGSIENIIIISLILISAGYSIVCIIKYNE